MFGKTWKTFSKISWLPDCLNSSFLSFQGINWSVLLIFFNPVINLMDSVLKVFFLLSPSPSSSSPSPFFPPASSRLTSLGLWDPVCDTDLSVLAGGRQCGALHEENLLQTAAALLHSPGHWHTLLQRPVSAHPRGRVHAAATHSAADTTCPCMMTGRSIGTL